MATTLTVSEFKVSFNASLRNDDTLAPASVGPTLQLAVSLAQGTGADQGDLIYVARRTLAANTAENLDLAGVLTGPLGATLTFARVKILLVKLLASPAAGPLLIGGHATAAFANWITSADTLANDQPKVRVRNGAKGGFFAISATDITGWAVVAVTADLLTVKNEHATIDATYDIAIVGASA